MSRRVPWIVAGVVVAISLAALADIVGDATQTRPEGTLDQEVTLVEMRVSTNQFQGDLDEAAVAAWSACSGHAKGVAEVHHIADDRYEIRIFPGAGPQSRHRIEGCINDANTERVRADTLSVRNVPAPVAPDAGTSLAHVGT